MSAWQSFHQREDLTTRLKNILDEYPAGVSTLREFVQNADDAGATRLVLCLDEGGGCCATAGEFPTEALQAYADGPALLYDEPLTAQGEDGDEPGGGGIQ